MYYLKFFCYIEYFVYAKYLHFLMKGLGPLPVKWIKKLKIKSLTGFV